MLYRALENLNSGYYGYLSHYTDLFVNIKLISVALGSIYIEEW